MTKREAILQAIEENDDGGGDAYDNFFDAYHGLNDEGLYAVMLRAMDIYKGVESDIEDFEEEE